MHWPVVSDLVARSCREVIVVQASGQSQYVTNKSPGLRGSKLANVSSVATKLERWISVSGWKRAGVSMHAELPQAGGTGATLSLGTVQ